MREALVFAIQSFTGAVVVVSHDRHLLSTVVDEFNLVADGQVAPFDGDLEDYHKLLLEGEKAADSSADGSNPALQRKERKRLEAEFRASVSPIKKEIKQIENRLEKWQTQLDDFDAKLADPVMYEADKTAEVTELMKQQGALKVQMDEQESRWMELEQELEERAAEFEAGLVE